MKRLNFYAMQINLNLYAMWLFMLCDQFHFLKQTLWSSLTYSFFWILDVFSSLQRV